MWWSAPVRTVLAGLGLLVLVAFSALVVPRLLPERRGRHNGLAEEHRFAEPFRLGRSDRGERQLGPPQRRHHRGGAGTGRPWSPRNRLHLLRARLLHLG